MPISIKGAEGLLLEEELSKISSKESAKTNGSASALNDGEVEGVSEKLATLTSKMSTSSIDMRGAESVVVKSTEDCMGTGEIGGAFLVASMVLTTNESSEEGLEVGKDDEPRVGELSAPSEGESAAM